MPGDRRRGTLSTVLAGRGDSRPRVTSSREAIRRGTSRRRLRTHRNQRVRFYDDLIKDKVVLINFMYAHCEGICPGSPPI
jgi:protein SCO1/2